MGPTWVLSAQNVGPMLAPWILLSGKESTGSGRWTKWLHKLNNYWWDWKQWRLVYKCCLQIDFHWSESRSGKQCLIKGNDNVVIYSVEPLKAWNMDIIWKTSALSIPKGITVRWHKRRLKSLVPHLFKSLFSLTTNETSSCMDVAGIYHWQRKKMQQSWYRFK